MSHDNIITIHARIYGRVQGVGYRYWTVSKAKNLNLCGWVRNRSDGTVEATFHGSKDAIDDMISSCYKGPSFANVADIRTKTGEYDGKTNFEEYPTK